MLDHENLDAYRVSIDFASWAYLRCRAFRGIDRHARDQLIRASQSIVLNVAESFGRLPSKDRIRFLHIANGSARECGAILDLVVGYGLLEPAVAKPGKLLLARIVAMLTRMTGGGGGTYA